MIDVHFYQVLSGPIIKNLSNINARKSTSRFMYFDLLDRLKCVDLGVDLKADRTYLVYKNIKRDKIFLKDKVLTDNGHRHYLNIGTSDGSSLDRSIRESNFLLRRDILNRAHFKHDEIGINSMHSWFALHGDLKYQIQPYVKLNKNPSEDIIILAVPDIEFSKEDHGWFFRSEDYLKISKEDVDQLFDTGTLYEKPDFKDCTLDELKELVEKNLIRFMKNKEALLGASNRLSDTGTILEMLFNLLELQGVDTSNYKENM